MSFFTDVEREVTVTRRDIVAPDVVALTFSASNGRPLPAWTPGAHIDVILRSGTERQYSLCSRPDRRDTWRIAVLREADGRGGSIAAHEISVGDVLRVRGPRSTFPFAAPPSGAPAVFIAGGIGITPILPMIHAAADAGADWVLHYAARSREALVSLDELQCYGDRVRVYVSEEGRRIDPSTLIDEAGAAPIWACGPERMITALTDAATQHTNLQAERFAPGALPAPAWRGPFDVELASTGDVISVGEDTSILEALEERGVFAVSSCREGTCGTCETVVIEGDVDHRDRVLTASERETSPVMMICVSRAACSRLVLDV